MTSTPDILGSIRSSTMISGLNVRIRFEAAFAVGRDFDLVAFDRQLVAIDVGDNLVVFDDEDFFHAGDGGRRRCGQPRLGGQKFPDALEIRGRPCRAPAARRSSTPDCPGCSNSRSIGTRRIMPSVALAPAQLWATRRTRPALSSRMASRSGRIVFRLLVIHFHQFAQIVGVAVGQIVHPLHFHRRLVRRGAAASRGRRFAFRRGRGRFGPIFRSCRERPSAGSAWRDNRPCRRRGISRGRPASPARSWR